MSTQQKSPLEIAQTKFKESCVERYGDDPSIEETKEVLQELIDEETNFAVKIAFTQIWQLRKTYRSDSNNWHDKYIGRSSK